jgi:hypothetical protein
MLGTPAACWAVFGCASLLDAGDAVGLSAAVAWGIVWLAVAYVVPTPRFVLRRVHAMRGRGARSLRGVWQAAVLSSLCLPLPVYLLAWLFARLHVAPSSLTLPMLAMLAVPAPAALWWMTLWPATEREEEMLRPVTRRSYRPMVSSTITPRHGSALR